MRKIEVCRKNLRLGGEKVSELVYYITVDEIVSNNGVTVLENYGVGIRKNGNGEEDSIRGITGDARKIGLILDMLASGTVTPIGLRDVLADMLECLI
ncbi:MAG: hypothetical protein GX250_04550 [Clostridiales bacterium]|jgi:hypothetical protein|nr:hypothetical protein [Clostridiales bacterium]